MSAKKRNYSRWVRAGIQVFFFLAMPGAFVAGFSGVKRLFSWIGSGEVLQFDSFVMTLIGLCAFTVIFGRYFCGFVCAFGSTGDFVYWISGLIQKRIFRRKKQIRLPQKAVIILQKLKYIILILIVVLCAMGVYGSITGWSPWDVFSRLTAYRLPGTEYLIGIVIFIGIIIGMSFQPRFFCQFLCPMGAVFALLPVLPWTNLKRGDQCISKCKACSTTCPVSLKLHTGSRDGECIACEACVSVCPRKNISRFDMKITKQAWIFMLVKGAIFFVLGVYLGLCRFL